MYDLFIRLYIVLGRFIKISLLSKHIWKKTSVALSPILNLKNVGMECQELCCLST